MKEEKKKQIIQLRRKDLINATKAAENMLSGLERRNNLNLLVVHAVNSVLLKRWQGHTSIVNKLTRMHEPQTVFSCSHDKTIKIWSLNGDFLSKVTHKLTLKKAKIPNKLLNNLNKFIFYVLQFRSISSPTIN